MSHVKYIVAMLIGPALFFAWLRTDLKGFYYLYSTMVVLGSILLGVLILGVGLLDAQNKRWKTPRVREAFDSRTYIAFTGYFISMVIFVTLIWNGKFVVASLVVANALMQMLLRHLFLEGEPHIPRPTVDSE